MKTIKRMAAVCTVLAMTFAMMMAMAVTSHAMINAQPLSTDDTWNSGVISNEGEADFYEIRLNGTGWLDVTYQGFDVVDSYYQILNENFQGIKHEGEHNAYYSSNTDPKTCSSHRMLEPGTYYIKVWAAGSHTGSYRLRAKFTEAPLTFAEPDNDFVTAHQLTFGETITGALTDSDALDFYTFTLTSPTTIIAYYTGYVDDDMYFELWDKDLQRIDETNVYYTSENSPKTVTKEFKLSAGTYYIKARPAGNDEGRYKLKVIKKILVNKISISNNQCLVPGKTFKLKAAVGPTNATDKTLKWVSADTGVASVDANTGKVTTNNVGKVKITANALDGSNVSKTVTVIVKPKKSTLYRLTNYATRKIYFSTDWQYGATGYEVMYSTSKNFASKTTKTKKFTNNSGYITRLAKGKYYVKVRAYYKVSKSNIKYGAWSSYKAVRVTQ